MAKTKSAELWEAVQSDKLSLVKQLSSHPQVDINWGDTFDLYSPLNFACLKGNPEIVGFLLSLPGIHPNLPTIYGTTPFYSACNRGHAHVVSMLLSDPRINVTEADEEGTTPFMTACNFGHVAVVSLLLADRRIDVNLRNSFGQNALWYAAHWNHLHVVKLLLAGGRREFDTRSRSTATDKTPAEQARANGARSKRGTTESEENYQKRRTFGPMIGELIDSYEKDPQGIRRQLRRQLGLDETPAGELFALVIYLSDGYFRFPQNSNSKYSKERRFFKMATLLPMDLQMVLCNRTFGLADPVIKHKYSELGFKKYGAPPSL